MLAVPLIILAHYSPVACHVLNKAGDCATSSSLSLLHQALDLSRVSIWSGRYRRARVLTTPGRSCDLSLISFDANTLASPTLDTGSWTDFSDAPSFEKLLWNPASSGSSSNRSSPAPFPPEYVMSCGSVNRSRSARKVGALIVSAQGTSPSGGATSVPELTVRVRDHDV